MPVLFVGPVVVSRKSRDIGYMFSHMALPVMEFQVQGYKIRKIFA